MDGTTQALDRLRSAVAAAGGPAHVARLIGTPVSHLGNVLCGQRPLGRKTAMKLRAVIALDAPTWLDLMAPPASDESAA